jgi:hypothetical protein
LDLGDDELIALFQHVDHKTKLNLMLTCKKFENVIGSYLELFGKFKLSVKREHLESPDRVQTLSQMRRHFDVIELLGHDHDHDLNLHTKVMQFLLPKVHQNWLEGHGHDLNLDTEAYNLVFQLLTRIGSKLVELHLSGSQFCFVSLVNLL